MTIEPISIRKQPWCRWWRGGQRQLNMDSLVPPLPARSQYMRGPFVLWTVRSKHNSFQSLYGQFGPSLQCNPPKERHMSIFGLEKRTVLLERREYGINSTFLNPPSPPEELYFYFHPTEFAHQIDQNCAVQAQDAWLLFLILCGRAKCSLCSYGPCQELFLGLFGLNIFSWLLLLSIRGGSGRW